ncbi:MAG: hypothetical protein HOD13_06810 [Rhodospirillaceae bacterium]|nr:hypothetical protein [Rhodospirillaceae bacterium]
MSSSFPVSSTQSILYGLRRDADGRCETTVTVKVAIFPSGASAIKGETLRSMRLFGSNHKRSAILGPVKFINKLLILGPTPANSLL